MSDGVFGEGSGEQNVPKQRSTKLIQKAEKGQSWGKPNLQFHKEADIRFSLLA